MKDQTALQELRKFGHEVTKLREEPGYASRCWCRGCGTLFYWFIDRDGYYKSIKNFSSLIEVTEYTEKFYRGEADFVGTGIKLLTCTDTIIKGIIRMINLLKVLTEKGHEVTEVTDSKSVYLNDRMHKHYLCENCGRLFYEFDNRCFMLPIEFKSSKEVIDLYESRERNRMHAIPYIGTCNDLIIEGIIE